MSDYLYDPSGFLEDPDADPEAAAEAEAYLNYILGGQSNILGAAAPYMSETPYMSLAGLIPREVDQIAANKKAVDYFQDLNMMAMDPFLAGFAGGAAFAPGTLEPRVSTTVVDRPNYRRVAALAAGDPDSYEGRIAQALLDGHPGSSALREIYAELDQYTPESDEWLAAVRRLNLPTRTEQGATVLDEERLRFTASDLETSLFEDPQPGTSEAVYDPKTGELVSSGGERFLEQDPNTGEMVLMERVVEESPLAEHYREAGLPLPTDQFTPEMILGPEWAAQSQALTREPVDAAGAEYFAALQAMRDYVGPTGAPPTAEAAQTRGPGAGGPVTAGTTGEPLVAGPGIPDNSRNIEYNAAMGPQTVAGPAMPTMAEMYRIQNPDEFLDWYNANANSLDDAQRWEAITYAQDRGISSGVSPQEETDWSRVANQLSSNLVEMTPSGSPAATIGAALTAPYNPSAAAQAASEAYRIQDPAEFERYVRSQAGVLGPSEMAELGTYALDQGWDDIGGQLVRGEVAGQPAAAGGGGEMVQGFMGPTMLGGVNPADLNNAFARIVQRGDLGPEQTAAIQNAMWNALAGEQPTPPGSTGNPDLDRALGINQLPPLDPNAPIMSAQPGGPVAPPPGPRPPAIPPNQGGLAPDINLTPAGGLAGPPAGDRTQDAMLAALLGGGPLTGQIGWQAAANRGVDLGAQRSAPDEQMRRAMLAAMQWQAVPGAALPPQPPPPSGAEWQGVPNRGVDLGAQRSAPDEQQRRAMLEAMVWRAAGGQGGAVAPPGAADPFLDALVEYGRTGQVPGQPQSNYPPISQMLDVLGGGTGQITPANYGGGPIGAPAGGSQIEQWSVNATARPRRSGRRGGGPAGGTQIEQWLANTTARPRRSGRRTSEVTEAERNQQAWDIADPRTEWLRTQELPRRTNEARKAWAGANQAWRAERERLYGAGSGFGKAMAMTRIAQQRGITPYVATVAARQQIPMAAGINTPGRVY